MISDSESEGETKGKEQESAKGEEVVEDNADVQSETELPELPTKKRKAVDVEDGVPSGSEARTSLTRKSNTARCWRGKRRAKLQSNTDTGRHKVAAFKPLKARTNTNGVDRLAAGVVEEGGNRREEAQGQGGSGRSDGIANMVKANSPADQPSGTAKQGQPRPASPHSTSASDDEEFHEPAEVRRRSDSSDNEEQLTAGKQPRGKSPTDSEEDVARFTEAVAPPPPRKGASPEKEKMDSTNSSLPLSRQVSPSNIPSAQVNPIVPSEPVCQHVLSGEYVKRAEMERAIEEMRTGMDEAISKAREAIRIDTKRMIRAEVKDELLLSQDNS